ncbi:MAG: Sulfate transport system permease protein CysT, partial [uncultured Nocardioidaceae bacterium]
DRGRDLCARHARAGGTHPPARAPAGRLDLGPAHGRLDPRARGGTAVVQPAGADPARRGRGQLRGRRCRRVPGGAPQRRHCRGAAPHRRDRAAHHGAQHRHGHRDRLGAGAGPVLGPVGAQRRHRPAVRAPDRGRGPGAAVALRPAEPDRDQHREHPDRGLPRAGVRHPAVRRPDGAAGARGARGRRRGGRSLPRRQQVHDRAPGDPAQPRPGHHRRRGAGLCPGDQRVRLAGAAQRLAALRDPGRLGAGARLPRGRQPRRRSDRRDRAAGHRARGHRPARHHPEEGRPSWL